MRRSAKWFALAVTFLFIAETTAQTNDTTTPSRVRTGLVALYDFEERSGPDIRDRSRNGAPLDLFIENMGTVRRVPGRLVVTNDASIRSKQAADRVSQRVMASGEITLEAWVEPSSIREKGPARLVTISWNINARNVTLGQDGDRYDVRLRTTRTNDNGIPSVASPRRSLSTKRTHVIYTRSRDGNATLYLNGKPVETKRVTGDLRNWDPDFRLSLAGEVAGGRHWHGTYDLVAIYSRALSRDEVQRNFRAGPDSTSDADSESITQRDPQAVHFEKHVAPVLANRCLECHDTANREGGLDLSQRTTAFKGDSGASLVPSRLDQGTLWESLVDDRMPHDREPLSKDEKTAIRQWIEAGAVYSLDRIDPAIYVHEGMSAETRIRRLTVREYITTVRMATGVDISEEARRLLPRDVRADGFSNTAYNLTVDLKHVDAYARLAETIVSRMDAASFAKRFTSKTDTSAETTRDLIRQLGRWILRGPLELDQLDAYERIANAVREEGGKIDEITEYLLLAMLQSPDFLYRVEHQRGDGSRWQVRPHELASRISYLVWGGPPDEELLTAADNGSLATTEGLQRQIARMLDHPLAIERSQHFVSDWLHLDRLDSLRPNAEKFPDWNPKLGPQMREETLRFAEEVLWKQGRPLTDLLNAQFTFATPELAKHYGLPSQGNGFRKYDLTSIPERGGLLTQGAVLTVGGDEASMVSRGLFVLHDLLRGVVKDPPPCVDTTPVPTEPGKTQRTIAEGRIQNQACGGCHARFEPLAFGLEQFDGLGSFATRDHFGNPLRQDGEIVVPGLAKPIRYDVVSELATELANSDRVEETLTWKVTQFAVGRPLVAEDASDVAAIHRRAKELSAPASGTTWKGLLTAIALSDLIRTIRTQPDSPLPSAP